MEEKVVEITDKGLSQRSEEVQEIMGPVPHWILRWGITLIAVVFIGLLAGSWFFRYPDVLQTSCTLTPTVPPETITAPVAGRITYLRESNAAAQKGDTLCLLQDARGNIHALHAPHTCAVEPDISLTEGNEVRQGQELFLLTATRQASILCLVQIPTDKVSSVREGQEVEVSLPQYPEKEFGTIAGHIARISHVPDANGLFTVRVDFHCPIRTSTGCPIRITYPIKGTAKIRLNDKRLIEKIIELRK